jgi:hypothetical protein
MNTKSIFAIALTVIGLTANAQVSNTNTMDSIKQAIASFDLASYIEELEKPREDHPGLYKNSSEYFGNFLEVLNDSILWKNLIEKKNGEYIFILAPGTDWILVKDKINTVLYNKIMIKSTVDSYYTNTLKKIEYDRFEHSYEIVENGNMLEIYRFFKDGKETDYISLGWENTRVFVINHFKK